MAKAPEYIPSPAAWCVRDTISIRTTDEALSMSIAAASAAVFLKIARASVISSNSFSWIVDHLGLLF
jgi:hypothetical protein